MTFVKSPSVTILSIISRLYALADRCCFDLKEAVQVGERLDEQGVEVAERVRNPTVDRMR